MITINKLSINKELKNIIVNITVNNISSKFTKVFVWNSETFRDYSKAIDVSDLLSKSSNNEDFLISAKRLGVEFINGLYFIEFRTDENPTLLDNGVIANQILGVVANLFAYKECLLNKVSSIKISDCGQVKSECDNCTQNICLLNTFINNLGDTILQGFVEEAARIAKNIEEMCDICHACPDYGNTNSFNGIGLGYQVVNNEILIDSGEEICNPSLTEEKIEIEEGFFVAAYIKEIKNFIVSEDSNPCRQYLPDNCYKDIVYWFYPKTETPQPISINRIYKTPDLLDLYKPEVLVKGPNGKEGAYCKVTNSPLNSGKEDVIFLTIFKDTNGTVKQEVVSANCSNTIER